MKAWIHKGLEALLDFVYPLNVQCLSCGKKGDYTSPYLCKTCYDDLIIRQDYLTHDIPVFEKAISGYLLNDKAKSLVYAHKFHHKRELCHVLAGLLYESITLHGWQVDLVTSVPSGSQRNLARGCDHAYDIAVELAKLMGVPAKKLLRRKNHMVAQHDLSRQDRILAVKNTCELRHPRLKYGRVLVIDDILTTGASLEEAGRMIRRQCDHVYGATVFYTPVKRGE